VVRDEPGLDQHAYRHEEDRGEHVTHGAHEMFDGLALSRFRHQRSRDEGAQRDRIARRLGHIGRHETHPDARDQRRFGAADAHDQSDEPRHDENADHEQHDEEQHDPPDRADQLLGGQSRAGGDGGEDGHEDDCAQVFNEEDPDHQLAETAANALFVEHIGDDRGAGYRDDGAGENALEAMM
jgi:hypothetical protein